MWPAAADRSRRAGRSHPGLPSAGSTECSAARVAASLPATADRCPAVSRPVSAQAAEHVTGYLGHHVERGADDVRVGAEARAAPGPARRWRERRQHAVLARDIVGAGQQVAGRRAAQDEVAARQGQPVGDVRQAADDDSPGTTAPETSAAGDVAAQPLPGRARRQAVVGDRGSRRPSEHVAGDEHLHDLGRPAVDGLDAGVEVGAGDRVLGHVAVAAEQLQAPVDDALVHLGRPPLRLRGVDRGQRAGVERADAVLARKLRVTSTSVAISAIGELGVLLAPRAACRRRCGCRT